MANNRVIELHQQWIGYLNPTGLVFSPNALEDAQVVINEGVISDQREFLDLVTKTENEETKFSGYANVKDIFIKTLCWRETDLSNDQELIAQYSFSHPQFGELVSPTYVAKVNSEKVILIQEIDLDDLDKTANTEDAWNSSPHFKFERLLREKQTSTGIIVSKTNLRLIFAPRGESSGYIDFPFKIMYQPSGRLVFSAFRALLNATRVFDSQVGESLIEVLEKSRKYQAQVSIELSGQVLAALYELLRGFQTANDDENGKLLEKTLKENPQLIYEGLLTTLLRMVFIMYAEDRNLLATDEVYQSSYSLAGLYERLRQDEAQNPDTMDSRYGAWAHLISLFRLIYDGAEYDSKNGKVTLPARHGHLFDPNIYLFLEGRESIDQPYNKAPKISDGVVFRVLKNLLVLENKETKTGERISYRTLDVEQIGSVYETMMGFELGITEGETIALKPAKSHGAPLPINLSEILIAKDKSKKLTDLSELKLSDKAKEQFNSAKTIEELEHSLDKYIDRRATPFRLSSGAMVLVPSEARRQSGSHYTPRELTEPIVRVALKPIYKKLGKNPTSEQILDLKLCDPAMGSGAFLVEACRQLSEKLVESWASHKVKISISTDEDELLHARRLIAQKCLYGVDRNHMAMNLAKLSLWLVTLAKDHSFSFLDHNLKHGDSLVGLTNKQIMGFDYADREELPLFQYVKDQLNEALEAREEIIHATDEQNYEALKEIEEEYLDRLEPLRLVGSLALKCFLDGKNEKDRSDNLRRHAIIISNYLSASLYKELEKYCRKEFGPNKPITFHWELEFPEVFQNKGFDVVVGNPPYLGGQKISGVYGKNYREFLVSNLAHGQKGSADLCAYFILKCANLLNPSGSFGLLVTTGISEGDSRVVGLEQVIHSGCTIYESSESSMWNGTASVVVATIHLTKQNWDDDVLLKDKSVVSITSFLKDINEVSASPKKLKQNSAISFQGSTALGTGFVLTETEARELKDKSENNKDVVLPYLDGQDINESFDHSPSRHTIFFRDWPNNRSDAPKDYVGPFASDYPTCISLLEERVKPERQKSKDLNAQKKWWLYTRPRIQLYERLKKLNCCFAIATQATKYIAFGKITKNVVFSNAVAIIASDSFSIFGTLSSSIHEVWARTFGSYNLSLIRYSPSDLLETYPFPIESEELSNQSKEYEEVRGQIMLTRKIGLTDFYNLFHDQNNNEKVVVDFRNLHVSLDKTVAHLYGWSELDLEHDFYETKQGIRFTISENARNEVIKRLIELNLKKHQEEIALGEKK